MSHVAEAPTHLGRTHASLLVGEFYRGLTHASRPALAICLSLNVGLFLLVCYAVTPDFMIRHGDHFLSGGQDANDLFATTDALALSRESGEVPLVVIIGGSSTRAALSKNLLAEHLNNRVSPPPKIFKLALGRMSLWEAAAFLEKIPDGARGAVILGVTSGQFTGGAARFAANFDSGRIGFRSPVIDRTLASKGATPRPVTGVYLIDNAPFFLGRWEVPLKRLVKPIRDGGRNDLRYLGKPRLSEDALREHSQSVSDRLAAVSTEAVEESFQFFQDTVRHVQKRTSMAILMVEAPVSDGFLRDFHLEALYAGLRRRTRTVAMDMAVDYVDLNASVDLPDAAFYDWTHLRDYEAVVECTRLVADRVAEILRRADWRRSPPS